LAEKKLRRKIDWYIMPTVTILYLMCFVDRANIGNARLAGLEADLGLVGYDYNLLLTVFYIVSMPELSTDFYNTFVMSSLT
jgi:hypothetical protein